MQYDIITIFPKILDSYYNESIIGRALKNKKIKINYYDLRDFTDDKRKTVDDTPYGGGPGMILKIEPLVKALQKITNGLDQSGEKKKKKSKIILLSPHGKTYNQKIAQQFSELDQIIFVNGYYEGVDNRLDNFIDDQISLGNFVLSNSELAVAMIIDSTARLLPGVLGNEESLKTESFTNNFLEYPQYTRPEIFKFKRKKYQVPPVLLSGNHAEIDKWRKDNSEKIKHS
ncbi:tRNA (guanosine(37)-N1)-methyltransferase TrmD [bacterium]|nr:tRNA (guanosine(37)-N1)-methyltransferase TrmD [bacterium]